MTTSIETTSGLFFDFLSPHAIDVDVKDIARALANTCRYAGHTTQFYSVAEHAILVHDLVAEAGFPDLALAALHHDSHEAYLGDVPTPLKQVLGPSYGDLRIEADKAIAKYLGIEPEDFEAPPVKSEDYHALRLETSELKHSKGIGPHWGQDDVLWRPGLIRCLSPLAAEALFLETHEVAARGR